MSLPEIDIWRAANLLLRQHGEDAEIVAARQVDAMNEQNDYGGSLTWLRIKRAVVVLQAPPSGLTH